MKRLDSLKNNARAVRLLLKSLLAGWHLARRQVMVRQLWPTLTLREPVLLDFDQSTAINVGSCVQIGPFSEIFVRATTPESQIPGKLAIGSHTWIGAAANIRAAGGIIEIGEDCLIAHNVSLIASNHAIRNSVKYKESGWNENRTGVRIGNNVWLGCGVIILPGCEIGDNAVIGAGSVVTKDVAGNTISFGVPALEKRRAE